MEFICPLTTDTPSSGNNLQSTIPFCFYEVDSFSDLHECNHARFVLYKWLISLSIVSSGVVHAVTWDRDFLRLYGWSTAPHVDVYLSIRAHLGGLTLGASQLEICSCGVEP